MSAALDAFIDAERTSPDFSAENVKVLYERVVDVLHKGLSEQRDLFGVLGSLAATLNQDAPARGQVVCRVVFDFVGAGVKCAGSGEPRR